MQAPGATKSVTSGYVHLSFIANSTTSTITYKPSTLGEDASRWTYLRVIRTYFDLDPSGYLQP